MPWVPKGSIKGPPGPGASKYTATIGDGSASVFTLFHDLGTRDATVTIYRVGPPYDEVLADVSHLSVGTVQITFRTPPAVGAFRVVITG